MRREEVLSLLGPALAARPYSPSDAGSTASAAAVLVIIHYHGKEGSANSSSSSNSGESPHIFLTKRSSSLRSHTGEISFPGGRHARGDPDLLGTALRETEEEIGIRFGPKDVAGSLQPVRTMTSNHFIVPFVTLQGRLPEHRIAPDEVEAVIDAPLVETLMSIAPDTEHFHLARNAYKFEYKGNVIWGATARILKQLYDLLIAA